MELCDSHCHIQSIGASSGDPAVAQKWAKAGITDPDQVIKRARDAAVNTLICVGCSLADSQLAVEFVSKRDGCWASVGIHPHEASRHLKEASAVSVLKTLAAKPKVVAIGECGLDYYYMHSLKEDQASVLRFQIELALEQNLPLIFHVRGAFEDFWPIFESYQSTSRPIRGVLHSFTDTQANLDRAIRHGLLIGVNGIATFTKDIAQHEIYRTIPAENLILETDAPFLTPVPFRGTICEPYHIQVTAQHLAQVRKVPIRILSEATTRNVRRLFSL